MNVLPECTVGHFPVFIRVRAFAAEVIDLLGMLLLASIMPLLELSRYRRTVTGVTQIATVRSIGSCAMRQTCCLSRL